jgi:hypothetical protein
MPGMVAGANTLPGGHGEVYLIVLGEGDRSHLVRPWSGSGEAQPAVMGAVAEAYDQAALKEPHWEERTLCGREWSNMAGGEAGPLHAYNRVALTATCKSCMRTFDGTFATPECHPFVAVLARHVAVALARFGHAEVVDLPGEQVAHMRRAVQAELRRLGGTCTSMVQGGSLVFLSPRRGDSEAPAEQAYRRAVTPLTEEEHLARMGERCFRWAPDG